MVEARVLLGGGGEGAESMRGVGVAEGSVATQT